jgi:hypothetical protein
MEKSYTFIHKIFSDLKLEGEKSAKNKTIATMNAGLGGNYASLGKDGKVALNISPEQLGNMTESQCGLYDVINESVSSNQVVTLRVLESDKTVESGAINKGEVCVGLIDIDDINNKGNSALIGCKATV